VDGFPAGRQQLQHGAGPPGVPPQDLAPTIRARFGHDPGGPLPADRPLRPPSCGPLDVDQPRRPTGFWDARCQRTCRTCSRNPCLLPAQRDRPRPRTCSAEGLVRPDPAAAAQARKTSPGWDPVRGKPPAVKVIDDLAPPRPRNRRASLLLIMPSSSPSAGSASPRPATNCPAQPAGSRISVSSASRWIAATLRGG